ncbi:MAG: neocarzinostatin apoprotein domain-containing protein [Acidimicrobiales bacterium]
MIRRALVAASAVALCIMALPAVSRAATRPMSSPSVIVTPTKDLHSGEIVTITVKGEPAGATLLALQCTPSALTIGEDGCENRDNDVFFGTKSGTVSTKFQVLSTVETATGAIACGTSECLAAVVQLHDGNGDSTVGIAALSFEPKAKASPPDAGPPAPPTWSSPSGVPAGTSVTAGKPDDLSLTADPAGDLSPIGAITGAGVTLTAGIAPLKRESGVALLQLVLAAPKTSWAYAHNTAAVVDVKVGTGPAQEIVLFAGARPFTYAAVFGTIATGTQHVTIAVDKALSTTSSPPTVRVIATRLSVVTKSNPDYLEMAYAPVVYGRHDTAASDTPMLTYATESAAATGPKGTEYLEYTTVWSKEDAGTSFVPWLEWGEWGRMADITQTITLDVTPSGAILDPTFNSCGCSAGFPVNRTSPAEETEPFKGTRYETHLIVRNASGNDYQSDTGTSSFRMEQAPIAGPAAGAARETVMDANPWTYRITAEELSRWYSDGSTSVSSPEIGDSRQYAIVDLSTTATNTAAIAVAIKLKGSSTWYRNDFGSGYSLYDGGPGRTAVKLPLGWESRGIAALELIRYPSGSGRSSVKDVHIEVLGLTSQFAIVSVAVPRPSIVNA